MIYISCISHHCSCGGQATWVKIQGKFSFAGKTGTTFIVHVPSYFLCLHIGLREIWLEFGICYFQTHFSAWHLEQSPRSLNGWIPQDPINYKTILVQVMAWCHQAPSHYLNQHWLGCVTIRCHQGLTSYHDSSSNKNSYFTYFWTDHSQHVAKLKVKFQIIWWRAISKMKIDRVMSFNEDKTGIFLNKNM